MTDTLWLEVDGLTVDVLTGIYSEETHLPQPLRISVRAKLAWPIIMIRQPRSAARKTICT